MAMSRNAERMNFPHLPKMLSVSAGIFRFFLPVNLNDRNVMISAANIPDMRADMGAPVPELFV